MTSVQKLEGVPRDELVKIWKTNPSLLDQAVVRLYVSPTTAATTAAQTEPPSTLYGLGVMTSGYLALQDMYGGTDIVMEYRHDTGDNPVFDLKDQASGHYLTLNAEEKYIKARKEVAAVGVGGMGQGSGTAAVARLGAVCETRDVTTGESSVTDGPKGKLLSCAMRLDGSTTRYLGTTDRGNPYFASSDDDGYGRYTVYVQLLELSDVKLKTLVASNTEYPYFRLQCCMVDGLPGTSACSASGISNQTDACTNDMTAYCATKGFDDNDCFKWAQHNPVNANPVTKTWCAKTINSGKARCECFNQDKNDAYLADMQKKFPDVSLTSKLFMCMDQGCIDSGLGNVALGGTPCSDVSLQSCKVDVADGANIGGDVISECKNEVEQASEKTDIIHQEQVEADDGGDDGGDSAPVGGDDGGDEEGGSNAKWVALGIAILLILVAIVLYFVL